MFQSNIDAVAKPEKILAMDIGSGTQDILIYEKGTPVENCVQMVLPSPTRIIAQKIARATRRKQDIFLYGNLMGGGPSTRAAENHLRSGLKVYATEIAALTFHDNLDEVRARGVRITQRPAKGTKEIRLGDVDPPALKRALKPFGLDLPASPWAIAVQDHGFNPRTSNRRFRFRYWEKFLLAGGKMADLIYGIPPPFMTRMAAVQRDAPGAAVMDTCSAAIWGALCDPIVNKSRRGGLIILNLGNQHTLGAFIEEDRVWGIFEHHTGLLNRHKIQSILDRFPRKLVSNEEIFGDGGHGSAFHPDYARRRGQPFVAVTGPRRALVDGLGYYLAAPYGNMMLAGCFGLVAALQAKIAQEKSE